MSHEIPIKPADGVDLICKSPGVVAVHVIDEAAKKNLSWDRFVRLKAAATAVLKTNAQNILDAGGFDGALALFLPSLSVDLVDPATTGGSILNIPAKAMAYDAVVAVDVLEHIEPGARAQAICELARVAKRYVILNYPCQDSKEAQELALMLTNNPLLREHVQWDLPDSNWVLEELAKHEFVGSVSSHTSIAVWLGQYVTLNLVPDAGKELSRHLVENYADEPCSRPLYHLIVCARRN